MAEMVYGQSIGISVPAGWYNVRFVGTEDRDDMVGTMGNNAGKAVPRMAWLFEVVDGPHRGERLPQETGTAAVQRSGALRMLTGLNGGPMAIGQKVNTDSYVGRLYRIKIAANPDSPKGNLHVADIELAGTAPARQAPLPATPAPAARSSAPLPAVVAPADAEPWILWDAANSREQPTTRGELVASFRAGGGFPTGTVVRRPHETAWTDFLQSDVGKGEVPY